MRRARRWPALLLLGVIAYLAVLIATAPASLAWRLAADRLEPPSWLNPGRVSGTLWSGSAAPLRLQGLELQALRWRLRPTGLLSGGLVYGLELTAADGHAKGRLRLGPGGVRLSDWRGGLPAARLAQGPLSKLPMALQGELVLDLAHLELDRAGRVAGLAGTLGWLGAAAGLDVPLPLGDLRGDLSREDDGTLVADLGDLDGPLAVQGSLRLAPDRGYHLEAIVTPRDAAAPGLRAALDTLAPPDAQGGHRLVLHGRL